MLYQRNEYEQLRKFEVLISYLGQMRDTVNETRGLIASKDLKSEWWHTHVRHDSKRFRFYVGFESHRCSNCFER